MAREALRHDGGTWVGDLQELRRPILDDLCLVAIAVSWLWWLIAFPEQEYPPRFPVLAPPLLPSLAALLALLAKRLPLPLRSAVLLLGVEGTFGLAYLWEGNAVWLYYQALSVVAAGLLIGPAGSFLFAALATVVSAAGIRALGGGASPADVGSVAGLVWATAIISWLSSRSLYTVLDWSLHSQVRLRLSAEEVNRRREELRSTLDSLRHAHNALERTSRDLQAATLEAEEARRVKSRFVANISHEFRTPLNIIVGFAEMLVTSPSAYGHSPLPPALQGDLMVMWRQAEHLLRMVDDVLDLAQIDASRFTLAPEPTDVLPLLREALTDAAPLFQQSRAELRLSLPSQLPQLLLDRTRMRQVVLNLLNNAVRYTPDGYVELGALGNEHEVIVYVKDTGRGIAADRLDSIFEEFERADVSLQRPDQGVGLGLAISRQLIRLHGGRIWVESELGRGSTFYIALPLAANRMAVQPLYARRAWPQMPRRDDEPGLVLAVAADDLVERTLRRHIEGKRLLAAGTVAEAAALARDYHPDMALIPCDDPRDLEPGLEQATELLAALAPFDLPVVVCAVPTERRASAALAVADCLIKPVTRRQLVEAMRRVAPRPRRVLIVDDEADMLRLLTRMAREEWPALEVRTASSVEEAAGLLSPRPDLVLLDLLMPGAGGLELLEMLRRDRSLAEVPVIIVTARGPVADLAAVSRGELRIVRGAGFSGGDIGRLADAVTQALPPHYGLSPEAPPDTGRAAVGAPA